MKIRNLARTIIISEGVEVTYSNNKVKLPLSTLDTQFILLASEHVIAKAGWSKVSEGLIGGTKLVLLDRSRVYEDTFIINQLRKEELAISTYEDHLSNLDFDAIKSCTDQKIDTKNLFRLRVILELFQKF